MLCYRHSYHGDILCENYFQQKFMDKDTASWVRDIHTTHTLLNSYIEEPMNIFKA